MFAKEASLRFKGLCTLAQLEHCMLSQKAQQFSTWGHQLKVRLQLGGHNEPTCKIQTNHYACYERCSAAPNIMAAFPM